MYSAILYLALAAPLPDRYWPKPAEVGMLAGIADRTPDLTPSKFGPTFTVWKWHTPKGEKAVRTAVKKYSLTVYLESNRYLVIWADQDYRVYTEAARLKVGRSK